LVEIAGEGKIVSLVREGECAARFRRSFLDDRLSTIIFSTIGTAAKSLTQTALVAHGRNFVALF
jgi:hypothetical protein